MYVKEKSMQGGIRGGLLSITTKAEEGMTSRNNDIMPEQKHD